MEQSVKSRQIMKVQLARGGGFQSSDEGFQLPNGQLEIAYLQRLGKIIESTILTRGLAGSREGMLGDEHNG